MTLILLIVVTVLLSIGQGALAMVDWISGTVIAAFVAGLMLLTRRL